jgi:hypothetical protein
MGVKLSADCFARVTLATGRLVLAHAYGLMPFSVPRRLGIEPKETPWP